MKDVTIPRSKGSMTPAQNEEEIWVEVVDELNEENPLSAPIHIPMDILLKRFKIRRRYNDKEPEKINP